MLREVYPLVKAANPDVQVLAGALAPTMAPPGSDQGVNDLTFLRAMYDAGAADFFDLLAIHAYGWHADPDAPADPEAINFRRAELLREIMVEAGDGDKHAMITEGGWNDHPRWTRAVRPAERIGYTLRAYEIAQEEWPWLDAVCLWAFRYPWDAKSYQDYFTFVRTDFEPKPIYLEVQSYARWARRRREQAQRADCRGCASACGRGRRLAGCAGSAGICWRGGTPLGRKCARPRTSALASTRVSRLSSSWRVTARPKATMSTLRMPWQPGGALSPRSRRSAMTAFWMPYAQAVSMRSSAPCPSTSA